MSAFITHLKYEFQTGIRNRILLLMNYLFPLGFYFMIGYILPQINPPFREMLIPVMTIFAVTAATLLGIPDAIVQGRESGIFRSYKINGIPSTSILTIPAITTTLHMVVVTLIIVVTAPLLFDAPSPQDWGLFWMIFFVYAFANTGISLLIGVVSPSSRVTILWSQLIFLPSMLIGGLMMPLEYLPESAQKISGLFPASQAMNAMNGLAMGKNTVFSPWGSVLVLVSGGILAFLLSIYLFNWDRKNSTGRGHPLMAFLVLVPFVVSILLNM